MTESTPACPISGSSKAQGGAFRVFSVVFGSADSMRQAWLRLFVGPRDSLYEGLDTFDRRCHRGWRIGPSSVQH